MKRQGPLQGLYLLLFMSFLTGCSDEDAYTIPSPTKGDREPAGYQGTVQETMDGGGYTYLRLDTGGQMIWAATPAMKLEVGQKVSLPPGEEMESFHSKSLDRTFDKIFFVTSVAVLDGKKGAHRPGMPASHPDVSAMKGMGSPTLPPAKLDFSGIVKPEGGVTVGEVHERKGELKDTTILLRGRVVKFSPRIMGINWVHIQDGTGQGTTADLTVTTQQRVQEGDRVLVKGRLAVAKDFGYGYKYAVIVEKAQVTVEKGSE